MNPVHKPEHATQGRIPHLFRAVLDTVLKPRIIRILVWPVHPSLSRHIRVNPRPKNFMHIIQFENFSNNRIEKAAGVVIGEGAGGVVNTILQKFCILEYNWQWDG